MDSVHLYPEFGITSFYSMQFDAMRRVKTKNDSNFIFGISNLQWMSSALEWLCIGKLQLNFNYSLHSVMCAAEIPIIRSTNDSKLELHRFTGKCFMQNVRIKRNDWIKKLLNNSRDDAIGSARASDPNEMMAKNEGGKGSEREIESRGRENDK